MVDHGDGYSAARPGLLLAGVAIVCVVLVALTGVVVISRGGDGDRQLRERLALLRAAVTPEPPPPVEAVLVSRQESPGDKASEGPAIEWRYEYSGTAAEFAAHYRSVLVPRGWREAQPGNTPGQIANFERSTGEGRVVIVVFAPSTSPNFELLALG